MSRFLILVQLLKSAKWSRRSCKISSILLRTYALDRPYFCAKKMVKCAEYLACKLYRLIISCNIFKICPKKIFFLVKSYLYILWIYKKSGKMLIHWLKKTYWKDNTTFHRNEFLAWMYYASEIKKDYVMLRKDAS